MSEQMQAGYPVSDRNQVKRLHDRGFYDHATVHALLDAAMLCHVSYVINGQPFCTPTFFWREGSRLYWHGSSASRIAPASGGATVANPGMYLETSSEEGPQRSNIDSVCLTQESGSIAMRHKVRNTRWP